MTALDVRYGRTPRDKRRSLLFGITAAVVVAATFFFWVLWSGAGSSASLIESRTIARETLNENQIRITIEVSVHDQVAVDCAVQATNAMKSVVGWKIIHVPTDEARTQVATTVVNTSELPDNGMVYRCWIP